MNAKRRREIAEVVERLTVLRDEEQEFYDNMPENFQAGEKGDAAQEAIDHMQQAIDELEGIE